MPKYTTTVPFQVKAPKGDKGDKGDPGRDGVGSYDVSLSNQNINIGLIPDPTSETGYSFHEEEQYRSGECMIAVATGQQSTCGIKSVELTHVDGRPQYGYTLSATHDEREYDDGPFFAYLTGTPANGMLTNVKFRVMFVGGEAYYTPGTTIPFRLRITLHIEDATTREESVDKDIVVMLQPPGADGQPGKDAPSIPDVHVVIQTQDDGSIRGNTNVTPVGYIGNTQGEVRNISITGKSPASGFNAATTNGRLGVLLNNFLHTCYNNDGEDVTDSDETATYNIPVVTNGEVFCTGDIYVGGVRKAEAFPFKVTFEVSVHAFYSFSMANRREFKQVYGHIDETLTEHQTAIEQNAENVRIAAAEMMSNIFADKIQTEGSQWSVSSGSGYTVTREAGYLKVAVTNTSWRFAVAHNYHLGLNYPFRTGVNYRIEFEVQMPADAKLYIQGKRIGLSLLAGATETFDSRGSGYRTVTTNCTCNGTATASGNTFHLQFSVSKMGDYRFRNFKCYRVGNSEGYVDVKADEVRIGVRDELNDTGIDIRRKKIIARADNFVIENNEGEVTAAVDASGELMAGSLVSRNRGNGYVKIIDGLIYFYNATRQCNIRQGVDENGMVILTYYNNEGQAIYDLGPEGIRNLIDGKPYDSVAPANLYEWSSIRDYMYGAYGMQDTQAILGYLYSFPGTLDVIGCQAYEYSSKKDAEGQPIGQNAGLDGKYTRTNLVANAGANLISGIYITSGIIYTSTNGRYNVFAGNYTNGVKVSDVTLQ